MRFSDTIYALSSGAGRAGVSVFRISGPDVVSAIRTLTGKTELAPRQAQLTRFKDSGGDIIDEGLLIYFKGPASFTGEDCAEFHTHGSPAVGLAMRRAFQSTGLRQAEPGEFTRRAFENGKLDLTEAEGLADLIDAETEGQRRQAYRQMQGGLKSVYEDWRAGLIEALAAVEGEIDFPDEQDVPDALSHAAYQPISRTMEKMRALLSDSVRGERVRSGVRVAIIGPPNAGKSTLLNTLIGREAAIVSSEAGTTRDVIDVHMDIAGIPVMFSDTAGIRETKDIVEAEGVKRARERSEDADLRVGLISSDTIEFTDSIISGLKAGDILVLSKSDMGELHFDPSKVKDLEVLQLSAVSGVGVSALLSALNNIVEDRFSMTESAGLTRLRHRELTERAVEALARGREHLGTSPELAGDDVRAALHAIKELAGETDIEAVLGAIFSRFCIGK